MSLGYLLRRTAEDQGVLYNDADMSSGTLNLPPGHAVLPHREVVDFGDILRAAVNDPVALEQLKGVVESIESIPGLTEEQKSARVVLVKMNVRDERPKVPDPE